jgi:hypothetical protein
MIAYYLECAWLYAVWFVQCAWAYAVAYVGAYWPFAMYCAQLVADAVLLTVVHQGARMIRGRA